jgi:hypothetical protein
MTHDEDRLLEAIVFAKVFVKEAQRHVSGNPTGQLERAALQLDKALERLLGVTK